MRYIFVILESLSSGSNATQFPFLDKTRDLDQTRRPLYFPSFLSSKTAGGGETPENVSGKIVVATWWLFGFITISSYTANLSAFLTVSRLEQSISSLKDLANQHKIRYAPIKGQVMETYFKGMAEIEEKLYTTWRDMALNESMVQLGREQLPIWDYPVPDKYTKIWRVMQESVFPKNLKEGMNRILNSEEDFAVIGDALEIRYELLANCELQQAGAEFAGMPYALAVQKGQHSLKDRINRALTINGRFLQSLEEKWWHNAKKVVCTDNSIKNGMTVRHMGGVFIIIMAAIIVSAITLTIEYICYRGNVVTTGHQQAVGVMNNGTRLASCENCKN